MALPNPNKELVGQSQTQTLTLKDLLYYQQETEKWSQNTDVNTFRGYIEEKQQGEELIDTLKNMQTGESNSLRALTESQKDVFEDLKNKFKSDSQILYESFERFVNVLATPFEKFFRDQNEKYFAGMGRDMFSATAQLEGGAARVNSGLKELTNGIGALGPAINTLRTGMYKTIAVFNVLFGTVQTLLGFFGKLGKVVFRMFGFGKEAAEREKLEEEHLKAQQALAEKEAEIKKQEALEGQKSKLIDPLPLPVTMGTDATASVVPKQEQKKEFKGIELPDGSMSLDEPTEAQNLRSEKLMKMDEERAELQKKYDLLDEKRNKKLDEEQGKKDKKFGGATMMILAALLAMILAFKMNAFSGPARLLSEGVKSIGKRIGNALTRILPSSVSDFFRRTPKNIPGRGGTPLARVPKGMQVEINGRPYRGGQMLPEGYRIEGDKVINAADGSASRLTKILGVVGREAIPAAGSAYEGYVDAMGNQAKFDEIQRRFDAGENFRFPDGERPMTQEEFDYVQQAMLGNIGGSAGRTVGGFTGAAIGFKRGMKSLVNFKWSDLVNPAAWVKRNPYVAAGKVALYTIGGGILGAEVGDPVATAIPEIFTGVEDSQGVLDDAFNMIIPSTGDDMENVQNETEDSKTDIKTETVNSSSVNTAIDNSSSTTIQSGRTSFFDWFNSNSYSNPTLETYNMK